MEQNASIIPVNNDKFKSFMDEVIKIYFGNNYKENRNSRTSGNWHCKCCEHDGRHDCNVRCNYSNGYRPLYDHVTKRHENFEEVVKNKRNKAPVTFFKQASFTARNIYGHIDDVISNNKPFSSVNIASNRLYSNLNAISRTTLMKYIDAFSNAVCNKIKNELPEKFGLIFDGWKGKNHVFYVAIYALYEISGEKKQPLLTICTLVDESSHLAKSYIETIKSTLDWYGKSTNNVIFIVSDNCPTNKSIATNMKVPLIGCYSHKANLAIKRWLIANYENVIEKIRAIVIKLRTTLRVAKLRELLNDDFAMPLSDQQTRWSSIHDMVCRYIVLKDSIEELNDPEINQLLPNNAEFRNIQRLGKRLEYLNEFTKTLQSKDINMNEARTLFDELLSTESFGNGNEFNYNLYVDSSMVHDMSFDNGIVKLLRGKEGELTIEELDAMKVFKKTNPIDLAANNETNNNDNNSNSDSQSDSDLDIELQLPQDILKNIKKQRLGVESKYNMDFIKIITPTSNDAERLFSKCRYVLTDNRSSTTPKSFEMRLILSENKDYWQNTYSDDKLLELRDAKGFNIVQSILDKDAEGLNDDSDE